MKNKIAVNTNSYHGFSVEEALKGIAAAGFEFVELAAVRGWTEHIMPDMPKEKREKVKELLHALNLKAVGLSGHCNLMDENRLNDFIENIKLAHDFGCEYIVSSVGEAHFGENESFTDEDLIANLKKLVPLLEELNIKLVIEIHGEYGTGMKLHHLCENVDSDYVGINYDTANCLFYGNVLPNEEILLCSDRVKYVHLKDHLGDAQIWNFPAVGSGDLKLKEFMNYMDQINYEGVYSVEIEYTQEFTMRNKLPKDLETANQAAKDSYTYLQSLGRI